MIGGPVQLMAFGYGSAVGAERRMLAELDALEGRGIVRLLDFLFVQKTADGEFAMLDVGDDEDYGTLLSGLLPSAGDIASAATPGVDTDELTTLASSLEPETAMGLVLVEHLWAGRLFDAIDALGGELLSEGFITHDGELIMGAEAEAIEEAQAAADEAQAVAAAARRDALDAIGEAADAVQAADAIRSAAALEALDALVSAGIVEQTASARASAALVEAGLVAEAAQEAAAGAQEHAADVAQQARAAEQAAAGEAKVAIAESVRTQREAADEAQAARRSADAVEEADARALQREVVEAEIARDAARADAEKTAQAVLVQEAAAVDEANDVIRDAVARESAAVQEADAAEELAERLQSTATITTAEKRLLRYLQSGLSFALVADKLRVSRGEAKSRAAKLYKKLGARNRDEAVRNAIDMGIVEPVAPK
jgi:DNA-binding CsgD family transcriptional regulator